MVICTSQAEMITLYVKVIPVGVDVISVGVATIAVYFKVNAVGIEGIARQMNPVTIKIYLPSEQIAFLLFTHSGKSL